MKCEMMNRDEIDHCRENIRMAAGIRAATIKSILRIRRNKMTIAKNQWENARNRALALFEKAKIVVTEDEKAHFEVADFGLNELERFGLELVIYVNTDRCCAKEMALFPGQICPEHRHPPVAGGPGKEETFRCRWGEVYLYVEGTSTEQIKGAIPQGKEDCFTVFHEIILRPGQQYTLRPNMLHWFQAGPDGAVVSEFSTHSSDETDIFTDPRIKRTPSIN